MPEALTRTDGRWGRILRALEAGGPLSFEALFPRIRDRAHTFKVDRQKCFNAVWGLRREGLIEGDQLKLQITDAGRTSFARVLASERAGLSMAVLPAAATQPADQEPS